MGSIPAPHTITHISRSVDNSQVDERGQHPPVSSAPVQRKVYSISRTGVTPTSANVQGAEFEGRAVIDLIMAVPNPEVYHAGDQIIVDGIAYVIDGEPGDDRKGPWPKYSKMTGGVVKLRRAA